MIALIAVNSVHVNFARADDGSPYEDDVYFQPPSGSSDPTTRSDHSTSGVSAFFAKIFGHRKNYLKTLDDEEKVIEDGKKNDLAKLQADQAKQKADHQTWLNETAEIEAAQKADAQNLQILNDQKTKLADAYAKQNDEYERLNKIAYKKGGTAQESKDMYAALDDLNKLGQKNTDTEKSLVATQNRLEYYTKYQADLKTKLATIQPQVTLREEKISSSTTSLSEFEKFTASKRAADKVLDAQKESSYDAKLLLADVKTLETKNHMTKMEIEGLKASLNDRLGNTLMGNYVNEQISKAMSNLCALQSACSVKSTEAVGALIMKLLSAPKGTTLEQVSGDSLKPNAAPGDATRTITGEKVTTEAK